MIEYPSRFELSQIKRAYERFRESPENTERKKYAETQLKKVDLLLSVSRLNLNQKINEIERLLLTV